MASSATSWSMEQVATPIVLECMKQYKMMRRSFDYEVVNFYHLGVPQKRKRLIAGSPDTVSRLRRLQRWHRSAQSVIKIPRGTHIRNYVRNGNPKPDITGQSNFTYKWYSDDESCVPISGPSHCVVAGQFLRWATPYSGKKLKLFNCSEMASLQCFPESYTFHEQKRTSMRCIGNAIPPIVMQQILSGRRPRMYSSLQIQN